MSKSPKEHRRSETWQIVYISRLNVCYWKAILKRRQRRSLNLKCGVPVVVFALTISPFISPIPWNPAIIAALLTLTVSLGTIFLVNAKTTRVKSYCRQWSELLHDSELLWREGDDLGWGRQHVLPEIERLGARMRSYQASEFECPDRQLIVQCERELHNQLGVVFPAEEGSSNV
jgi:hypothetical protein